MALRKAVGEGVCWGDPTYGGDASGKCAGCSGTHNSLLTSLVAINGGKDLDYTCSDADGKPATCIEAQFKQVRLATPPPACQ